MTGRFITGIIGSPYGLKGSVKVRSVSGEIEHLLKLKEVIVSSNGKEKLLQIEESTPSPPLVLMRFKDIDTPEKAKSLSGAHLLTEREQAAPLNKDEFYIEDLKGLPVTEEKGMVIGHLLDIIEGGGGELAEIRLDSVFTGGQEKIVLVPFRSEFFPEINPEKSRIILKNLWILE